MDKKKRAMTEAEDATYIISPNIKSPMGANLSALAEKTKAEELKEEYGGETYDWSSVQTEILK